MKHDKLTNEITETAGLYSLGALCQHEARAFEQHLAEGCEVCELEKKRFEDVVASLGTAREASPPAYVRDLLAARVEREPQERKRASSEPIPMRTSPATPSLQQRPQHGNRWSVVLPWAVAASLLIALVVTYRAWQTDKAALQREARNQIDELARDRDRWREIGARAEELTAINEVLSTAGSKTIALAGQQAAPFASGRIYWDVQSGRWVVSASLPPTPPGKVYQLWFVMPDAKISAGLIKPNEAGHGFLVVRFPSSVKNLAAAAITLEPEGGSAQPTMPIYALGSM